MDKYISTNLNGRKDALSSITTLEKELSEKLGKEVAVVAYSPIKYAALNNDSESLAKISELEKELSEKTGKDILLVAFAV